MNTSALTCAGIIVAVIVLLHLRQKKAKLTTSTGLLLSDRKDNSDPQWAPIWDSQTRNFRYQDEHGTWFSGQRVVYSYGLVKPGDKVTVQVQDNANFGSGLFLAQFAGDYILFYGYYSGTRGGGFTDIIKGNNIAESLNNSGLGGLTWNGNYPNSITATFRNTGGVFTVTQLVPYTYLQ